MKEKEFYRRKAIEMIKSFTSLDIIRFIYIVVKDIADEQKIGTGKN